MSQDKNNLTKQMKSEPEITLKDRLVGMLMFGLFSKHSLKELATITKPEHGSEHVNKKNGQPDHASEITLKDQLLEIPFFGLFSKHSLSEVATFPKSEHGTTTRPEAHQESTMQALKEDYFDIITLKGLSKIKHNGAERPASDKKQQGIGEQIANHALNLMTFGLLSDHTERDSTHTSASQKSAVKPTKSR